MVLLGGRAAEALAYNEISTGAADDLGRATDVARRMVTEYGMSPTLGPVRLAADPQAAYLGQAMGLDARVSQTTSALVDVETRRLVEEAAANAQNVLAAHRPALDQLAARLCEQETVTADEIAAILAQTASHNGHPPAALGPALARPIIDTPLAVN